MKVKYSQQEVNTCIHNIIKMMFDDNFKPDYIVGLSRGGLIPAVQLSHYLGLPMRTLKVSLSDKNESESNSGMAEDAFGYDSKPKNILIIDDICDTGATFEWIMRDWESDWNLNKDRTDVWHNNVRFASLIYNDASKFDIDYYGYEINKDETPEWCVFPWENWW